MILRYDPARAIQAGITGPGAAFRSIASERQGAGGDQAQIARKHLVVKLRSVWQQCLKPVTRGGRFSTAFGAHRHAFSTAEPARPCRAAGGQAASVPGSGTGATPPARTTAYDRRAVPRRRPTSELPTERLVPRPKASIASGDVTISSASPETVVPPLYVFVPVRYSVPLPVSVSAVVLVGPSAIVPA